MTATALVGVASRRSNTRTAKDRDDDRLRHGGGQTEQLQPGEPDHQAVAINHMIIIESATADGQRALYTADERGNIKAWGLRDLFTELGLSALSHAEMPSHQPDFCPRRTGARSGDDQKTAAHVGPQTPSSLLPTQGRSRRRPSTPRPGSRPSTPTQRAAERSAARAEAKADAQAQAQHEGKGREHSVRSPRKRMKRLLRLKAVPPPLLRCWRAHKAAFTVLQYVAAPQWSITPTDKLPCHRPCSPGHALRARLCAWVRQVR